MRVEVQDKRTKRPSCEIQAQGDKRRERAIGERNDQWHQAAKNPRNHRRSACLLVPSAHKPLLHRCVLSNQSRYTHTHTRLRHASPTRRARATAKSKNRSELATCSASPVRRRVRRSKQARRSAMSEETYRQPVFIGLLAVMSVAVVLLLHHCVLVVCCGGGGGGAADRRRRRQHHHRAGGGGGGARRQGEDDDDDEEEGGGSGSYSVEVSSSSRAQLVAAAVVCTYRAAEKWGETTCPVCLADFADGEAVRVLPECMHYFHADCIDTWLRGSTSCPMCRAETTPPPPSPAGAGGALQRQLSSLSVSLEEILVRT
ncbi:hypothetical protein ACP4OV_002126 [Aristida adscensionis]